MRRRHLDRAGVEQGRPRRGQRERLRHAAEAGVDRERDGHGAGGPAFHQLGDELGEPGDRDDQRAEQTAVVGGAGREVLVDHRRHGRARALGHERRVVDDRAEQRGNTVDRCPAGLGDGGHDPHGSGRPGTAPAPARGFPSGHIGLATSVEVWLGSPQFAAPREPDGQEPTAPRRPSPRPPSAPAPSAARRPGARGRSSVEPERREADGDAAGRPDAAPRAGDRGRDPAAARRPARSSWPPASAATALLPVMLELGDVAPVLGAPARCAAWCGSVRPAAGAAAARRPARRAAHRRRAARRAPPRRRATATSLLRLDPTMVVLSDAEGTEAIAPADDGRRGRRTRWPPPATRGSPTSPPRTRARWPALVHRLPPGLRSPRAPPRPARRRPARPAAAGRDRARRPRRAAGVRRAACRAPVSSARRSAARRVHRGAAGIAGLAWAPRRAAGA